MRCLVLLLVASMACALTLQAAAQQQHPPRGGHADAPQRGSGFELTSPALVDGAALPDDLKCTRDGGDGLSPPLTWTNAPQGVGGFAIVIQHYPRGTYPGVNAPSHYWLVWNIPAGANGVTRGNPEGLGIEGSDKDIRAIGYTPPCSPAGGGTHEYMIWVYALDGPLDGLPQDDSVMIGWADVMTALNGHVLDAASVTFIN